MQKQLVRLQKILSSQGAASRREAEKMILEGRVLVNGVPAKLGQSAEFGSDHITLDGVELAAVSEHVYIMLNKPCGYITTVRDDRGRRTVMDLIADAGTKVYPVGRLDMNTEGLLLFTNDGEFANTVAHPSHDVKKTYEAKVIGDVQKAVGSLRQPIEIDNCTVEAVKVELHKETINGGVLRITVIEGRNRQVRKMCAACGVKIIALKRISIGALRLGKLKTGQWRHLSVEEVQALG